MILYLSICPFFFFSLFFFFNDTATTEIYTLSLHDALPIWIRHPARTDAVPGTRLLVQDGVSDTRQIDARVRRDVARDGKAVDDQVRKARPLCIARRASGITVAAGDGGDDVGRNEA